MTKEQLKRAKEIEAELRDLQEKIQSIAWIMDRGVANVGIEAIGSAMYRKIFPKHETTMDFLKTVYDEYLHRKKVLEEEFDSL